MRSKTGEYLYRGPALPPHGKAIHEMVGLRFLGVTVTGTTRCGRMVPKGWRVARRSLRESDGHFCTFCYPKPKGDRCH